MSGVYWGVTALHLLGHLHLLPKESIVDWVLRCQHVSGGFGGSEKHDPHILYTLSAVQILAIYGELRRIDAAQVAQCALLLPPVEVHAVVQLQMQATVRNYCSLQIEAKLFCRCSQSPTE